MRRLHYQITQERGSKVMGHEDDYLLRLSLFLSLSLWERAGRGPDDKLSYNNCAGRRFPLPLRGVETTPCLEHCARPTWVSPLPQPFSQREKGERQFLARPPEWLIKYLRVLRLIRGPFDSIPSGSTPLTLRISIKALTFASRMPRQP